MVQKDASRTTDSTKELESNTYKLPRALIIFFSILATIGIGLGIVSFEDYPVEATISFIFGLSSIYLIFYVYPTVIYDNQSLQVSSLLKQFQRIRWEEIDRIEEYRWLEGIKLISTTRETILIPGQFQDMIKFIGNLRSIRRDLFSYEEGLVLQWRPSRTLLTIAATIIFTWIFRTYPATWLIVIALAIRGVVNLFRLPYKVVLSANGKILLKFILKKLEVDYSEIQPPVHEAGMPVEIVYWRSGRKGKIPLRHLLNNDALLFCNLRTWWEDHRTYLVIPLDIKIFGPCECCGNTSLTVWGELQKKGDLAAVYYVHWTHTQPDHGASFDLVIGKWGKETSADDRYVISLAYRIHEGEPNFAVIDAETRPIAESELAGTFFRREQVIGTPMAQKIYSMVDEIYIQDIRIAELRPQ